MVCLMLRQCTADYVMLILNDIHVQAGYLENGGCEFC